MERNEGKTWWKPKGALRAPVLTLLSVESFPNLLVEGDGGKRVGDAFPGEFLCGLHVEATAEDVSVGSAAAYDDRLTTPEACFAVRIRMPEEGSSLFRTVESKQCLS